MGFAVGSVVTIYAMSAYKRWLEVNYNKKVENTFEEILNDSAHLSFLKRINSQVYLKYRDWEVLYHLERKVINIFKGEDCLATSSQISKSKVIKKFIKLIENKWSYDIQNIVTIDNIKYSANLVKGYSTETIIEDPMDLDDILDKINKVGLNNLTKEEKEFLNNSYK
jgi:hypothetical protein